VSRDQTPIGFLFVELARPMFERAFHALAERGYPEVRAAHARTVRYIGYNSRSIRELAELSFVTKQSMSEIVSQLEQAGYVVLTPDPNDGRAKRARLTVRGVTLLSEIQAAMHAEEDAWADVVGPEDLAHLRQTLLKISGLVGE
jgi:DNA-binding MarR family transcriptional regulator